MSNLLDQLVLKTDDERIKNMADMRWMSDATGTVYEAQVEQLKKLARLTFDPYVAVISIFQDIRLVKVESEGPMTATTDKYPEMLKFLLGGSWTVQMCYNVKHGPAKTRRKWNNPKSKGKKRSGALSEQRRRKH